MSLLPSDGDDEGLRRTAAVAALVMVGQECTCGTDPDITHCPNYMPGDEQPGAFEEDE